MKTGGHLNGVEPGRYSSAAHEKPHVEGVGSSLVTSLSESEQADASDNS